MDTNNKAKQPVYDLDGYDIITRAILDLLNQYPNLVGDEILFTTLDADGGKSMFASSGAVVNNEKVDITDHVTQECMYTFSVMYRAGGLSESRKIAVKEWLDNLGRWLEKQPITVGGEEYKIDEYPSLTAGRKFTRISRSTPAYLYGVNDNQTEDWNINLVAYYRNEFDR